eukprot:scaffold727_cov48-Attheya_sp.AAC.4
MARSSTEHSSTDVTQRPPHPLSSYNMYDTAVTIRWPHHHSVVSACIINEKNGNGSIFISPYFVTTERNSTIKRR